MTRTETVATSIVAFFFAICFVSGVGGCVHNSENNTKADTVRMTKCVDQGKDWLYVDRAGKFQCVGGGR